MKRHKVLIVDDDESTRSGLSEFLVAEGFATRSAGTFEEIQHALRCDPPDLLIADIRLGELNGVHLLIIAENRFPVIVITGFQDSVLEATVHSLGADYILKPIDVRSLVALIRRRLDGS